MRPVTHTDVTDAARCLIGLPEYAWPEALGRLVARAHAADLFRKRTGRDHRAWGDGSLSASARANGRLPDEPHLSDRRYIEAFARVLNFLIEWRGRQFLKD